MKKLLLSIILIYLIIFIPLHSPSTAITPSSPPISLNLWVQDSTKQVELYFNQAILRFHQKYPAIKIQLHMIKGDNLKASHYISTARINQHTPDLIASSLTIYNKLATEHFLYPLDDVIATYPDNYFLDTLLTNGKYNDTLFGIPYELDPELLVYRKDFLDSINIPYPENLNSITALKDYAERINTLYQEDCLDKVAFAIPTLTSDGGFIASLLHHADSSVSTDALFETLATMYQSFDVIPYHYRKIGTHPFLSGKAAIALEPLSLIYTAIEKDNNLLKKIGIMPLPKNGMQFAYSKHKYLSVCSDTDYPEESILFLKFFFSPEEVLDRYKTLNLPVVLESLMPTFIKDSRFDNQFIHDYVRASFHYNLSPTLTETLQNLDTHYDYQLHKDSFIQK